MSCMMPEARGLAFIALKPVERRTRHRLTGGWHARGQKEGA